MLTPRGAGERVNVKNQSAAPDGAGLNQLCSVTDEGLEDRGWSIVEASSGIP